MINAHHPSSHVPITSPTRKLNTSDKPLHGPWLVVARLGWGAIALINLLIFVLSIPAYAVQLHLICTTDCHPERVTLGNAVTLTHLGISLDVYFAYNLAITLFASLVFLIVGAIIFWRKSQVLIGLLVSLLLITFGCCGSTLELVSALSAAHSGWIAVQLISQGAYIIYPAIGLFFCLFPDGRFVPRWSWLLIGFWILSIFPFNAPPDSPFFVGNWPPMLFAALFLLTWGIGIGVQIYRYRYVSRPEQRQQTKWFVFACSIAILRYRLWDIDILIRRTLVYATLTASLALVYVCLVIGLQALLRSIVSLDNSVAIVLSTLAIYALFQPFRRRIQRIIDQRFYRSKYDAAKTVAAFNATLRQEVDLDLLSKQLVSVVEETMQPAHGSLWLVQRESRPARLKEGESSWA